MVALEIPRPVDALAMLCAAVDAVAAEDIDGVGEAALEEQLVGVRRQMDRLEADFCRRLRRFERARGFVASGAASVVSWLRTACRMSAPAAHERVEVARALETCPEIEESWRSGAIGYQHVAVLARSQHEVGPTAFRRLLGDLLDAARRLDPSRLRYVTRYLRYCVDPDGSRSAEEEARARRYFNLSQTLDGIFVIDGQLDPEAGSALRTAIAALNKPLPNDERSAGQRRADALGELAHRQLRGGSLPSSHGQRPHLVVTVPAKTVRGAGTEPGEMAGGGLVSPTTVRRLACDAAIAEIAVDESGAPVRAGEESRSIPAPLRTALTVRDRGCRFPSCDRPPEWTDAHHIRHRADNGPTRAENLVLLCRVHHRLVHEGGWRLDLLADGSLEAIPP